VRLLSKFGFAVAIKEPQSRTIGYKYLYHPDIHPVHKRNVRLSIEIGYDHLGRYFTMSISLSSMYSHADRIESTGIRLLMSGILLLVRFLPLAIQVTVPFRPTVAPASIGIVLQTRMTLPIVISKLSKSCTSFLKNSIS